MIDTGYVVLPDHSAAESVFESTTVRFPLVASHDSGRPWLLGRRPAEQVVVATKGPVRVAVIGACPVTATELGRLASHVRSLSDVGSLARKLPGSSILAVSVHGRTRIQGSIVGLHPVFYARVQGVDVAADRADVLAAMAGASINEETLAVRVACGRLLPAPLSHEPLWEGVSVLAPDNCLVWGDERAHETRWWTPPAPEQSLGEGAGKVREVMAAAMEDRGPGEGRLSTDLSGGMDSTSLCFLAARKTPDLLTFRTAEADVTNDDALFASHSMGALPTAEHLVAPQEDLPSIFTDPGSWASTEEPYPFIRTGAQTRYVARLMAKHGSRRHLAGHGGDELFTPLAGYLHKLLLHRPGTALKHVRGYSALKRWPLAGTTAALLRPGSVRSWWQDQAAGLTAPPPPLRRPVLGWGLWPLRASPWVTETGIELARTAFLRTAVETPRYAEDLGQHQLLLILRSSAFLHRLLREPFARESIHLDMPFFDDRLIEAVLAVKPEERSDPWRYKPLLSEAMRGVLPDMVIGRSTKGEFSEDVRIGIKGNVPALLDVFADSRLAARGLIDADRLKSNLLAPQRNTTILQDIEYLLGCESWLRAVEASTPTHLGGA